MSFKTLFKCVPVRKRKIKWLTSAQSYHSTQLFILLGLPTIKVMFTISFLYLVKGNRLCLNHFCRFWGIVEYDGNETTIESKGII